MSKFLVIGLDGATLDLIEPWANEGKLPVLANLMHKGAYGRLQSVLPVLSSAAWPSFFTGMNPGKHGLYDFVKRVPQSYRLRPVNRENMRGRSLWRILSDSGRKVIVINVPMTYPPEPINGKLITGLGTPNYKTFTHPPELTRTLLERGYQTSRKVAFGPGAEQAYLQESLAIADQNTQTALWLMNEQEWDFLMVVYREPDDMAHFFWHYMDPTHPLHPQEKENPLKDAILHYYQKVDQAIGQLLEASGPDTNLMIMSDHGTGAFYKGVLLNEWLRQHGWLVIKSDSTLNTLPRKTFARLGLTRSNISSTLRRMKMGRFERWIKDILGNRIELLPTTSRAEFPDAIDWQKTKAYSFGYHGQIYINLQGREPSGIVSPGDEYDQLCKEISNALLTLIDPEDGKPVVDQVVHRSQVFHGPAFEDAPDLFVIMRALSYITIMGYEIGSKPGEVLVPPHHYQSGCHRMEGVLAMAGPAVRSAGYIGNQASLPDLAPTILHLMGFPVPEDMDGKVLGDLLLEQKEVKFVQSNADALDLPPVENELTPEQEQELIQQLKNLGYLE